MVGPDDAIVWKDVATGGAAVISAGAIFVVNSFTRRLDRHEEDDRRKFSSVFEGQKEIAKEVAEGFLKVERSLKDTHIKLLERISDIQQVADYTGTERRHTDRT